MCCKSQSNATTTTQMPAWLNDASQTAVGKATDLANKPFQSYSGERVADFSPTQNDAFTKLGGTVASAPNVGPAALAGASAYGAAPAQNITAQNIKPDTIKGSLGDIASYFNPNTEAALQPALRKIQESSDAAGNQIRARATSAHAFGDARHGVLESTLDKNRNIAVGDTSAKAYQDMYNNALATLGQDVGTRNAGKVANAQWATNADTANAGFNEQALQRLLTGSNAQETIAQSDQNRQLQQLQAMLGVGALQQGHGQAKDDAAYQEFLRNYGDDFQKLSALSGTLKSVPHDTTASTTTTQPDNSGFGLAGSAAGSAAGSPGFWGWLGSMGGGGAAGGAAGLDAAGMALPLALGGI